jgi:hypothetical protein
MAKRNGDGLSFDPTRTSLSVSLACKRREMRISKKNRDSELKKSKTYRILSSNFSMNWEIKRNEMFALISERSLSAEAENTESLKGEKENQITKEQSGY